MIAAWIATATPFTAKDSAQFRASAPPPYLGSGAYLKDYDEVKALGALVNSSRTPEQTDVARFYSDNAILYWNRLLRTLAGDLTNLGDSARLFALVNMAMADALIKRLG